MIQHIIDITGSTTAWLVVFFRIGTVLKKDLRNQRVVNAWLFALCFALFDTFQIDAIYVAFDNLVGLNNLSWLLSYIFLSLTIYYVSILCHPQVAHWAPILLFSTIGLIITTFSLGPGVSPENTYNVIPRSTPEMLYMVLCYFYATVMLAAGPIRAFFQAWRKEKIVPIRLRTLVALLSASMAFAFFASKSVVVLFSFAIPVFRPLAPTGNQLASLPTLGLVIFWPLCYAPHWFYTALGRPLAYLQSILALRELHYLLSRLDDLLPLPSHLPQPHWQDLLRNPDFYVYRKVIEILDKKRSLEIVLEESRFRNDVNAPLEKATHFHRILQGISQSEDFEHLLSSCIAVSKQIRSIR
jgi:hypothetical protein